MRFEFLGWRHWRWCLREPFQWDRVERHTDNGIRWYARLLFWAVTRYQSCTCGRDR